MSATEERDFATGFAGPEGLAACIALSDRCRRDLKTTAAYASSPVAQRAALALEERAARAAADPQRVPSLLLDLSRIRMHLARGLPIPQGGGLKALVRAARRSHQHSAARNIRERIADRGALAWTAPDSWPENFGGYEVHHLGDSRSLMRESAEMANCVADFEQACTEGHYRIASLRPRPGYGLARCSVVIAYQGDGLWVFYACEAPRHGPAPRLARDATEILAELAHGLTPPALR